MNCAICGHPVQPSEISEKVPEKFRRFCYDCHLALHEAGKLGNIVLVLLKRIEKLEEGRNAGI